MRIYFDNAASTPIDPEVLRVMTEAWERFPGNPSSIHLEGRSARAAIEQARKTVAKKLNASIGEIFFTSGGTESNNMAIKGAVRDLGVKRILSSPIEHHCNLHSFDTLLRHQEAAVEMVRLESNGQVDYSDLESRLAGGEGPVLVSLMHANNETGLVLDIDRVSELCQQYSAYFHTDTVQTIGQVPIDLQKTKIHFLAGSAHKFHGPKGTGFIYINNDIRILPYIDGGSQERNMRAGTENIAGILGLAEALELAYDQLEIRQSHLRHLQHLFIEGLKERFEDVQFNGDPQGQGLAKIVSASFPPGPRSSLLIMNLDIEGISASGGSACSSGADAGSHVMAALYPGSERVTVRFSFSHNNTEAEVGRVLDALARLMPEKKMT